MFEPASFGATTSSVSQRFTSSIAIPRKPVTWMWLVLFFSGVHIQRDEEKTGEQGLP